MSDKPISDLALLSDCHSAALLDVGGSIEWWCVPRFDSPSIFGRILGAEAGYFSVGLTGRRAVERRYLDDTLTVETTTHSADGVLVSTDALALAYRARGHELGQGSPHRLLRKAACLSGRVELEVHFVPRFEYGLTVPIMRQIEGGMVAIGGPVATVLSTSVPLRIESGRATGRLVLGVGEEVWFGVEYGSSWLPLPRSMSIGEMAVQLNDTNEAWRSWMAEHNRYDGPYAEAVSLSGRVLQGLTYVPTGAIVAAPTTSLPETVGGGRNCDYRYAWVRDASLTMDALWVAACPDEEQSFLRFLTTAASSVHHRDQVQIMFGVGGERDLTERELGWLEGWRNSRPVRVGNGAWNQRQNDVYGELLAAAHRLRHQIDWGDDSLRALLITLADLAGEVWQEPDQGIWEMRDEPRHHPYSKLMCWVALDRAIEMAPALRAADRLGVWGRTRDQIRKAILERGWSEEAGAFTQSFGSAALDASALVLPIVGFLSPSDPRILGTIEAIESDLMDESGLLLRYRAADGLEGAEGGFLLCTFWLSQAHALAGRVDRAREVFERAASFANDLGLLSEEVESGTGALIGNFPQAFSHIGLINAAWAIHEAQHPRREPALELVESDALD
ncbi:glycoside hydrolase family 15 protein [soil metagenome]